MLHSLHIENIAVIERMDVEFSEGLNVLTGETGAGKSVIIDSIEAVLGARTSRELIRAGAEKSVVSAVFSPEPVEAWLKESEIDAGDGELILTRRISSDGKGSCRVNGVPVTVSQLRELGSMLLDIHGQNDGRQLLDEARHCGYLDGFGDLSAEIAEYKAAYESWREVILEEKRLSIDDEERERQAESLRYRISEIEEAGLEPGEGERLSERRDLLRNAGKLTEAAGGAYDILYADDASAVSSAAEAARLLSRASGLSGELEQAEKLITEALYTLEDASERLRDFKNSLDFSPEEHDEIETRLNLLNILEKKYGCGEAGMLELLDEYKNRLDDLEYADDRLAKLKAEKEKRRAAAANEAGKLTKRRVDAAGELKKRIENELHELSMPSARFEAQILPAEKEPGFGPNGADVVRFLMSANAGEAPGRISRIASGGELSRIMLAMKNVLASADSVPTLIFDEIDAGVSGVAAQRVGEKLGEISRGKQVLCVTHLPQIAAMADTHFVVEKSESEGRTFTKLKALDDSGRQRELARLHGGDIITENTLKSALEQLEAAQEYKRRLNI